MYATYYLIPGSCALACLLVILLFATQIFVAASRSQVSRRADDTQGLPAY